MQTKNRRKSFYISQRVVNLEIGNIVEYHNPQAGKKKYHLCVRSCLPDEAACFLFINSKSGYEADCVLPSGSFPCLPPSPTGQSVVSFSLLVRANERQLALFSAVVIGDCPAAVAATLEAFCRDIKSMPRKDHAIVAAALSKMK